MTVKDIWKLRNGAVVKIGDRQYMYENVDGRRVVIDTVIRDSHDVDEWFGPDEEIQWVEQD